MHVVGEQEAAAREGSVPAHSELGSVDRAGEIDPAGDSKLREATTTHLAQIDQFFVERLDGDELERVAGLLERIAKPAPSTLPPEP